jgi:hypothetical protein
MIQEPDITLQAVAVTVASSFVGHELAAAAGAYTAIMIGWLCGVMVGVLRLPAESTRLHMFVLVFASLGATLGMTVPLSHLIANAVTQFVPWYSASDAKSWLFPVAGAIPAIGHSWGTIAKDAWALVKRRWVAKDTTGQS